MYEELLNEAEQDNITVVYRPMRGNIKGLYYDRVIALNKNIDTTAEKTCILAEELGHYFTSVGNILDQNQLQNRKLERRARAWGYQRLVPLDKLILAYKQGIRSRYELAEYLEVTEQFLADVLKYYKEKYGPLYFIMTKDGRYLALTSDREGGRLIVSDAPQAWRINKYSKYCTVKEYSNQNMIVNAAEQGNGIIISYRKGSTPDNAKLIFTPVK